MSGIILVLCYLVSLKIHVSILLIRITMHHILNTWGFRENRLNEWRHEKVIVGI